MMLNKIKIQLLQNFAGFLKTIYYLNHFVFYTYV